MSDYLDMWLYGNTISQDNEHACRPLDIDRGSESTHVHFRQIHRPECNTIVTSQQWGKEVIKASVTIVILGFDTVTCLDTKCVWKRNMTRIICNAAKINSADQSMEIWFDVKHSLVTFLRIIVLHPTFHNHKYITSTPVCVSATLLYNRDIFQDMNQEWCMECPDIRGFSVILWMMIFWRHWVCFCAGLGLSWTADSWSFSSSSYSVRWFIHSSDRINFSNRFKLIFTFIRAIFLT